MSGVCLKRGANLLRTDTSLFGEFGRLQMRIAMIRRHICKMYGFSDHTIGLLIILWIGEEAFEPGFLANRVNVSRQTMTYELDRLEEEGLAVRVSDDRDKRRKHVKLTDKGIKLLNEIYACQNKLSTEKMNEVPEEDWKVTLKTLGKYCEAMENHFGIQS